MTVFNEFYTTPNESPVTAAPRRGAVLHHCAATNMDYVISLMTTGSKQVSADGVVKDARRARMGNPALRKWSLSSPYWDSVLRSIECANESTAGWTISDASHWSMAMVVAEWSVAEGWWPHRDGAATGWTVYGHREIYTIYGDSYATACPGGMDLNLVVARAQSIIRGGTAGGTVTPLPKDKEEMFIRNSARGDFICSPGVVKHSANSNVFNIMKVLEPTTVIYTVTDQHINAFLAAFGCPGDQIPVNGGIWVDPKHRDGAVSVNMTEAQKDEIAAKVSADILATINIPTEFNIIGTSTAK